MLDACVNQAAGLALIAAHNATRVIAMASHGDQRDELDEADRGIRRCGIVGGDWLLDGHRAAMPEARPHVTHS